MKTLALIVTGLLLLTIAAIACGSAPAEVAAPAPAPAQSAPAAAPAPAAPAPQPAMMPQQPRAPAPAAPAAPAQQGFQSQALPAPAQVIAQPTRSAGRSESPSAMMSSGDVTRGGHLIWGVGPRVFPPKWDMTQAGVWHFTEHFNRHYSGILQFNPRNGIDVLPDLGESWEFAPSVDEITVNLHEGVMWHDGQPLTVEDIAFTLNRWANPPEGIPQPRVGGFKNIAGTEKIDDSTFMVSLHQPSADFLLDMADAWHIMLPKHIVELEGGINSPDRLIGTGSFRVKDTERDSFVLSEANPDYFRNAPDGSPYPYLDLVTTIQFTDWDTQAAAVATNRIDLAAPMNLPKGWGVKESLGDKVDFESAFSPGVMYISMNGEQPPFDDIRARRALYLAVHRAPIQATLSTPIPELPANFVQVSFLGTADPNLNDVLGYYGYDAATREEAGEEAKRLFAEMGITELTANVGITGANNDSAQIVVQQLEDLGIKMNLETYETAPLRALGQDGNYNVMFDSHAVAMANPVNFIDLFYLPGAGAFYHNAPPPQEFLDKVDEIKRTFPGPERDQMFKEIDTIMREQWIPKVPTLRFNEYKLAWAYVNNWDPIPAMKFIQTRLYDVWISEGAPQR